MAKPKIALVPAAQGSKFYSVLPSSGVGDFNFTRSGSATRINSQGLIETVGNGVSRLNYPMIDGKVVGCPHHILEPVRTNVCGYSDNLTQWSLTNGTLSSNSVISPDGSLNADKVVFNNTALDLKRTVSVTANTTYTFSFYIKLESGTGLQGRFYDNTNSTNIEYYDYSEQVIGTDWTRVTRQVTTPSGCTQMQVWLLAASTSLVTASFWGAQLEVGSYETSYIPTPSASIVTRSAETATGSGDASTFNDSEGVLMVEGNIPKDENVFRNISISDGSSNNFVTFYTTNTLNKITYLLGAGGQGAVFGLDYFFQDITIPFKIALVYSSGRNEIWVNGIKVKQNSNTFNLMSGLNELSFDNGTGSGNWYGNTKQAQYYDSVLTDSELETLTSWVSFSDMANGQLYTIE